MKKLIVCLLALILAVSLCACGEEAVKNMISTQDEVTVNTNDNRALYEKACSYIEKLVETKAMTPATQDEMGGQSLYCTWLLDEGQRAADLSEEVTLLDQTVTIGKTTVKELKEMGFTYETDMKTVDVDSSAGFVLNKDKKWCNVSVSNLTGAQQNLDDLALSEVTATDGSEEMFTDAMPITYSGIKVGTPMEELVKTLGTPNDRIELSCDEIGANITLVYASDTVMLTLYLNYDADRDQATLKTMTLSTYDY